MPALLVGMLLLCGGCGGAAAPASSVRLHDSASIAFAPVRIAHTPRGQVAYREIGAGPPLVLITGYSGTMEGWDPRFVDALARHFHVVTFNNAGIGGTAPLPSPLTIDAMAGQTSALIDTLRLGRVDVLGWAMGSLIAQALAVVRPAQVNRLILCATYPGNGTAIRPSQQVVRALTSGNQEQLIADLFPPDQAAAGHAFLADISAYPAAAPVTAQILSAQGNAVEQWWGGTDPAGKRATAITVPMLVADGTLDQIDPVVNSRAVARLSRQATLKLYPDAAHAFLIQDQTAFIPLIESFLR